ncbi:MAG TPA: choice-of-anchor P family protein, partial [Gemmatimonadales bacterium]|nr:choice-of-anchor P family protein [Gemmatimonadales bacterium]
TVRTGYVARQPLPCQGTSGITRTNDTAGVDKTLLGIAAGAASGTARGDQTSATSAYAQTKGRIARAEVGVNRSLVIEGVVGAANVRRDGAQLTKTSTGTRIASITLNGRTVRVPTAGNPVTVGQLATLSAPTVKRTQYGISVVALHVDFLDSTVTLNLGIAKASIRP